MWLTTLQRHQSLSDTLAAHQHVVFSALSRELLLVWLIVSWLETLSSPLTAMAGGILFPGCRNVPTVHSRLRKALTEFLKNVAQMSTLPLELSRI